MASLPNKLTVNVDMGEGYGQWKLGPDAELMPLIDYANVACGFHAGDPSIMLKTVRLAKAAGVKCGAHPGLPDLRGFGRRVFDISPEDVYSDVLYQVGALAGILRSEGMELSHIKPHGMLYFYALRNPAVAQSIARVAKLFNVPILGLPKTAHETAAREEGVEFLPEAFVDIDYSEEGTLLGVPQSDKVTAEKIRARVLSLAETNETISKTGKKVPLPFDKKPFTICLHSDMPGAFENVQYARKAVDEANGKLYK